jgi:hypothetical protein
MSNHKRLGECLVETNVISREQLTEALRLQKKKGGFLGRILLEQGWISDRQLCQAISEALHVNCVSIDSVLISEEVIKLVPASLAATSRILPLFIHGDTLYLAMENPRDTGAIQLVEFSTGMTVKPMVVPQCQLRDMLRTYYNIDESLIGEPEHEREKETVRTQKQAISSKNYEEISGFHFSPRKRLGEILVETELISQEQLDEALRLQKTKSGFLGQILVDLGWITEQEVCRVMAESLHVECFNDGGFQIPQEIIELVPESLAASCNVFPLYVKHNVLYLAMENPLDTGVIQLVEFSTGMKVEPLIASPSQLQTMIQKHYREGNPVGNMPENVMEKQSVSVGKELDFKPHNI